MAAERKPARRTTRSAAKAAASTSVRNTGHTGSGAARVSSAASVSTENGAFCSRLASEEVSTARPLAKCAAGTTGRRRRQRRGHRSGRRQRRCDDNSRRRRTRRFGWDPRLAPSPAPCWMKGRYCACSRLSGGVAGDGLGGTGFAATWRCCRLDGCSGCCSRDRGNRRRSSCGYGEAVDVTVKAGVAVAGGLAVQLVWALAWDGSRGRRRRPRVGGGRRRRSTWARAPRS